VATAGKHRKGNGLAPDFGAAFAQVALGVRAYGEDIAKRDTLPRVRVKPIGGPVKTVLQQNVADDLADLYDPDSVTQEFYIPAEDFYQHAMLPVKAGGEFLDPPMPHRIQLVEGFKNGKPVLKEILVRTGRELQALTESAPYKRSRLLETTGEWRKDVGGFDKQVATPLREAQVEARKNGERKRGKLREHDPFEFGEPGDGTFTDSGASVTRDIDQEFIPILGGPFHKQLYLYDHWSATAKCFEMKNHSDLARAAITTTSDFVLGRGINWRIRNTKVARVWEEFWRRNRMERRLRQWSDDYTWQGELVIRKEERLHGYVTVRAIDPTSIYEIVTNPADIEEVYFYHVSYPTQYQLPYTQYHGMNLDIPIQKYVIEQIPDGEIFHVRNNVSAYEKWGRSDFFASLGTLKRHRDWTNATVLKDLLQANLVWKVKVEGDDADVEAFMTNSVNNQLPAAGGLWVENNALELTAMHSDVAGTSRTGQGSPGAFLTALFATAQQMPVSYFNLQGTGPARATALVQGEPFTKKISTRQQTLRYLLDRLYADVIECAQRAGRLSLSDITHGADVEWIFPSTFEEDRSAKFGDLRTAYELKAVAHRAVATSMAQDLGIQDYNYDKELEEVKADSQNPLLQPPAGQGGGAPAGAPAPPAGGGMPKPPQPPPVTPPGMNSPLAGASSVRGREKSQKANHQFRQYMHDGTYEEAQRVSLTEADRTTLEEFIAKGRYGRLRLPSGIVAKVMRETNG
jgi:hypothetical protein